MQVTRTPPGQLNASPMVRISIWAPMAEPTRPVTRCAPCPLSPTGHSMKPPASTEPTLVTGNPDEVSVPVTVRPILAYQVVSRDAFVSPATRTLKMQTISRQLADRLGVITSVQEALGAITRQDIPAGRYLRHSDLLKGPPVESQEAASDPQPRGEWSPWTPGGQRFVVMQDPNAMPSAPAATAVGDRPAITRFIPPGRTAFAIPLNRIYGAEHLQIGDSIDLLASYSLERLRDEEETETRPDGTVIVRKSESLTPRTSERTWEETFGNRAEPWFVASDAIVVAPVGFPAPAAALRALSTSSASTRPRNNTIGFDGPPVIIAVENRDVDAVATALATRDALFTVAFHAAEREDSSSQQRTIAIAPESINAYSELRETAWQGNRRQVATRRISSSDTRFADALSPEQLSTFYGRILKVDKKRGDFFTSEDFLPAGASPGLAASAREGFTLLPIADREIEGIDSFRTGDRVTILLRGVVRSELTRRVAPEAGVASSVVVAESVRIVRGSVAGQSVLEVRNQDLNRLQAAMARSLTDRDSLQDRSHLVAVGVTRDGSELAADGSSEIAPFDPLEKVKTTQVIIGGKRSVEVFVGSDR